MTKEIVAAAMDLLWVAENAPQFLLRSDRERIARAKAVFWPMIREHYSRKG